MKEHLIVLVEDNPNDEALALRALRKNNVTNRVLVLRDGAAVLDYFLGDPSPGRDEHHDQPTVVLLDLKLPKIDGLEVLRRLRADDRTRLLPVVILTSSREEQDLVAGYRLGANSYVRKPVDFIQFVEAIGQLGLYWLVINEPPPAGPRHGGGAGSDQDGRPGPPASHSSPPEAAP